MVKGSRKVFQANGPKKQVGVVILISDKIDSIPKPIKRNREGQHILIKGKSINSKHWFTKHKGTQVHKRNTPTAKPYSHSG